MPSGRLARNAAASALSSTVMSVRTARWRELSERSIGSIDPVLSPRSATAILSASSSAGFSLITPSIYSLSRMFRRVRSAPASAPSGCEEKETSMAARPATLGVLLAGGLARRMGGGDKPLRTLAGPHHPGAGGRAPGAAVRWPDPQRERRPRALRRVSGCRSCPTACRASPGRSPVSWRHSTRRPRTGPALPGWRAPPPTRRSCRATSSRACTTNARRAGAVLACAKSGGQVHPTNGLWPVRLRDDLRHALAVEGVRKIDRWTARHGVARTPLGRPSRSIRSSTPTRPRTSPRPSG